MSSTSIKGPIVGFDLGGTKMLCCIVDDSMKIIGHERKKTRSNDGSSGVDRIIKTIRAALDQANMNNVKPAVIGIAVPGALDLDSGIIIDSPNLGWHDLHLKDVIGKEFGCPVYVSNDVDAGVYGEYRMGAAQNARCVVGIFPGTGIGGGCIYKGEMLRGAVTSCMEIGHIPVVQGGRRCGCGRYGCLETVASRLAISAEAAMAVYRGEAPNLEKNAGTDLANIRSGVLAEAIASGDAVIEQIVREAARWLGKAVATVVNLIAPDIVILGGGLVEAMPSIYKHEVEKAAKSSVMPAFEKTFRIETAQLGDDATALGAAAWGMHLLAVTPKEGERS